MVVAVLVVVVELCAEKHSVVCGMLHNIAAQCGAVHFTVLCCTMLIAILLWCSCSAKVALRWATIAGCGQSPIEQKGLGLMGADGFVIQHFTIVDNPP